MQQFMMEMMSNPDSDLNQFLNMVQPSLNEDQRALLGKIKTGAPIDFETEIDVFNALVSSIQNAELDPAVGIQISNTFRNGRNKALHYLTGVQLAQSIATDAESRQEDASQSAETVESFGRTIQETPEALQILENAKRGDGTVDTVLLSVFDQDNPDFSEEGIAKLVQLANDPRYQSASPMDQASMLAHTTRQSVQIEANNPEVQAQYNFYLPPGVSHGLLVIDPSGDTRGSFESGETPYIVENDGTIIAEHLLGVPDAEDLRVPPTEWATAQALGAMTDGFVIKSAAELAQSGETLGNRALVNFMKQYWGIRGNNTLPESELDKFKSLGEMMSDNHINLHTVLSQLNAVKWDNTADGSRALDVRNQFNQVLEAAAAGNNAGFRELLSLDNLPPDVPTTA
jgi:hypothetical protein